MPRRSPTRSVVYQLVDGQRRLGDNQYAVIDLLMRTRLPIARLEVVRRLSTELEVNRAAIRSSIASLQSYDFIVIEGDMITKVQIELKQRPQLVKRPQNKKGTPHG